MTLAEKIFNCFITMPLSKGRHNRQISVRHADLLTGALFIFDTAVRKTICPTYHKDY